MKNFYTNCITLGNRILYRGYEDGDRVQEQIPYKPSLFIADKSKNKSKFRTLDGKVVDRIEFGDIEEARDFVRKYQEVDNFLIYGNTNYHYCYLSDRFRKQQIDYDFDSLKILFLDIETSYTNGFPDPQTAQEPVIAITFRLKDHYFVFGTKDYIQANNVHYFKCENEKELLTKFIQQWEECDPDIISGWNIEEFDIPYLINRISKVLSDKHSVRLSPWRKLRTRKVKLMGREYDNFELCGISTLDYIQMYKKFIGSAENYKLNTIASMELGEGKIQHEGLAELYEADHQKFIEYNIKDVELVHRLDKKMKMISMICAIAYDAKVNFIDVFAQVRLWDTIIYNYFREKYLVLPQKERHDKETRYAGAYVKDPQIGLHDWVVSFDLDSLYPHLIAQFNISPEMLVPEAFQDVTVDKLLKREYNLEYLKQNSWTLAANGHHFKTEKQGFLPEILMSMYNDRKVYKNKMLDSQNELERIEQEIKRRGI